MKQPLNERLKIIIAHLHTNPTQFAREADIEKGTFNRTINGHSIPRFDMIEKILEAHPVISLEYLMNGEGPPLQSDEASKKSELQKCKDQVKTLQRENKLLTELNEMLKKK